MYNIVPFTLTESQIGKLKTAKAASKPATLELSQAQIGGQHELYLTNTQIRKLEKGRPARITFSKTQVNAQRGGWLGALLRIAKSILPKALPILGTLGLAGASGAISGATHKATAGTGLKRAGKGLKRAGGAVPLYFSKKDMGSLLETVKMLEGGGVLEAGTCEKCMRSVERQEGGFIGALLASLAGSILPALLGNGLRRAGRSKKS